MIKIIRSNAENEDFIFLVKQLDAYLKTTDGDEHNFYNQFNSIKALKHVVIAYIDGKPSACGAFKKYNENSVEVKRMFTTTQARNKGIATKVLTELEDWAKELNYSSCILETGIRQQEAVAFYKTNAYQIIPNYGQYKGVKNSLCFEKKIKR
ncbi:GNAT family N-acetyltransferase [Winogradskyella litoriviva]|uniref:GNAT family N-acetyltransferase n=1 Tax=Winogradskyella litoriviva TaxID=1220182 RepID=A0ABX2E7Y3_9FLAO|nr:GNAT family N-acetyltransferase [Winogradskyella litoriviva]NRD23884.1 GNAT family N-acetyltransferase [Winogradskyella litoriviva]